MYAVAWQDLKLKTIITNVGTTLPGAPHIKERHKKVFLNGEVITQKQQRHVPRPNAIEQFFRYFSVIDVHDHLRQGSLNLEEGWRTQTWWHRIFATMLGVIITDCFMAYRYERKMIGAPEGIDFNRFLGRLAYELIFNVHLEDDTITRQQAAQELAATRIQAAAENAEHTLAHICHFEKYKQHRGAQNPKNRFKLKCCFIKADGSRCQKKSPWYCRKCSTFDQNGQPTKIFAICGTTNHEGRQCYLMHLPHQCTP
jgi:hypothetical protein